MRLEKKEREAITSSIQSLDSNAEIYLFGSRTDLTKKGGDIDILVISQFLTSDDKIAILAQIFETLEEQKIDLIIVSDTSSPFVRLALKTGIKL